MDLLGTEEVQFMMKIKCGWLLGFIYIYILYDLSIILKLEVIVCCQTHIQQQQKCKSIFYMFYKSFELLLFMSNAIKLKSKIKKKYKR